MDTDNVIAYLERHLKWPMHIDNYQKKKEIKESLVQCQTIELQRTIEEDANVLNDAKFKGKISPIFVAKEFKYHRSCRTAYHDRAKAENQK